MRGLREVRHSLQRFTLIERRDVVFYIIGVMFFKVGTEAFNGSIIALATDCYDIEQVETTRTFQRIGLLQGLNMGMRCFGSILVGPLIKRYPIRSVLSCACILFGVSTASVIALDASTGGTFKPSYSVDSVTYYGTYNPDALIPIYAFCGIGNGMVDLIRSIIPRDIVGGHVEKLQLLDALVRAELA
jgi:MFS family permease